MVMPKKLSCRFLRKNPQPARISSGFYKACWNDIGPLGCNVFHEFFHNMKMLKNYNTTSLLPPLKVDHPTSPTNFRLLLVLMYFIRAFLIYGRLESILPALIDHSQREFIQDRELLYNVLLCQELAKRYNKHHISPRYMLKIYL